MLLPRLSRPPSRAKTALGLALVALALLGPGVALADAVDPATRAAARKLGEDGTKLFDAEDFASALDKYNLADQLVPSPTLGVRAARCLVKLGRLVEASERYLDVTRIKLDKGALAVQHKAQLEANEERDALLPSIPTLELVVTGPQDPGIIVTIDGKPVPPALIGQVRPIDPGDHEIEVKRASLNVSRRVVIAKTEHSRVAIELPPLAPSADKPKPVVAKEPWQKVAGRAGIAIGIAGVVIGASHGIASIVEQSSLSTRCPNRTCASDAFGALDFYDVTRAVSSVGFIVGGIAGAAGITLLLTAPPDSTASGSIRSISPYVGANGAGIRGEF